jgi:MerR family transcriptional regulator, light-induced transcriptional regulator
MATSPQANLSISAVERETGLSKDTLRVWERRYNFPRPERSRSGERIYPIVQVEKLRLIKHLIDHGYRPGKLVGLDAEGLRGMTGQPAVSNVAGVVDHEGRHDLQQYVALCKSQGVEELRRELMQCLLRMGMFRFVTEVIAPLTTMVGAHWASGDLAVFEEHLYTETLQAIMRNAIASTRSSGTRSGTTTCARILLTTVPAEPHGLGLLMSEAIFAVEGAQCISLGVQTPVVEIVQAAKFHAADIVALSFSAYCRPAHVLDALANLRTTLPAHVEIWAGGRCAALGRRLPVSVKGLELDQIPKALAEWRRRSL